jgi:hypothetical protein
MKSGPVSMRILVKALRTATDTNALRVDLKAAATRGRRALFDIVFDKA